MRPNQQDSFYSGRSQTHYSDSQHLQTPANEGRPGLPGAVILWTLRKLALLTDRLIVIAKYQFYKNTAVAPGAIKTPVLKLGVLGFLAFIVFKKDLSLNLGVGASRAQFGQEIMAEEVALKTGAEADDKGDKSWGGIAALFEKKDYFADDPADDAETRRVKAYIRRYKKVAVAEMEKYGIPASVKLAQAIIESNAGSSALSKKTNNHFGIKCFSRTCKKGHCSNFGDDSHKDFFRNYGSAWESYRSHSEMIANGRYKELLKYGNDYKKWARGLKELGYATAGHYDDTIIEKIEKYHLDELDK